jgi:DNA (cytosine-5)-methyltransferase 1
LRKLQQKGSIKNKRGWISNCGEKMADFINIRHDSKKKNATKQSSNQQENGMFKRGGWWSTEPNVGRVANGVSKRVDRLKALGNAQVPIVVATAWEILTKNPLGIQGASCHHTSEKHDSNGV